jgi:DNA-binding GntR family transcriptional regulator
MLSGNETDQPIPRRRRRITTAAPAAAPEGMSLSRFAYDALREEIRARRLLPGHRVREVEVAERLGISRTPVREALKKLASEGLLEQNSARGFVVTEISTDHVMQLYAMREMLEGAAARFAAQQASPLEIQSLRRLAAHLASAATPAEAATGNRRLHNAIAQAAHNAYLLRAIGVLRDALELLGTTTYSAPGRIASGYEENMAIIERIAARDPDGAESAARRHIQSASVLRLNMLFGVDMPRIQSPDTEKPGKGKTGGKRQRGNG